MHLFNATLKPNRVVDICGRLLEQGAKDYINHPRGAQVEDGELVVSGIFDWYKTDFGGTDAGVPAHLRTYARPELVEMLADYDNFDHYYDWRLNAREIGEK